MAGQGSLYKEGGARDIVAGGGESGKVITLCSKLSASTALEVPSLVGTGSTCTSSVVCGGPPSLVVGGGEGASVSRASSSVLLWDSLYPHWALLSPSAELSQ